MNRITAFIILSLLTVQGFAQMNIAKKDVPHAVINAYVSQNSKGVTDSLWSKEEITIYKVNYIDNGQHYEADYFEDGRWIKTYTEIDLPSIPANIVKQANAIYPNHTIKKAYIELNNDGKFYATDLVHGNDKMTVYFTMAGKFVK